MVKCSGLFVALPFLIIFVSCNRDGDIVKVRKIDMAREMEIRRGMERGEEGES
jgi:hypothetical protein